MAITQQVIGMFYKKLGDDCHNHPSHLLVSNTATLSFGKIEHEVEHTVIAYRCHLYKMKHIKTISGIVKLYRRIASPPQHQIGQGVYCRNSFIGNSIQKSTVVGL